jgi:hypothetical protein
MSPVFPARRRADEFDRLVEAAFSGDHHPGGGSDLHQLVTVAAELRALPPVTPRPEFSADLRARLMTAAATELTAPDPAVASRLTVNGLAGTGRRRQRRITIGIAALAVVGATAGTAIASEHTLPGDTLYPVKRAMENIQAGFSQSDQDKGSSLLADANTRLTEVKALSQRHQPADATQIEQTLGTFASQAKSASDLLIEAYQVRHDPKTIADLHAFAAQSVAQLTALESTIPAAARPALAAAAQTLLSIDRAAGSLCPTCAGGGVLQLPSSLLNGLANVPSSGTPPSPGTAPSTPAPGNGPSSAPSNGPSGSPVPKPSPSPSSGLQIPPVLPTPSLPGAPSQAPHHAGRSGGKKAGQTASDGTDLGDVLGGLNDAVGGLLGGGNG